MTELKPFQESTVQAVLAAFDRRRRTRRFLVADEVGLGKTVVAQHVILRLFSDLGRPLVVFYMCSNLAIARQNRRKLLEILPSGERESADCPVDRLAKVDRFKKQVDFRLAQSQPAQPSRNARLAAPTQRRRNRFSRPFGRPGQESQNRDPYSPPARSHGPPQQGWIRRPSRPAKSKQPQGHGGQRPGLGGRNSAEKRS